MSVHKSALLTRNFAKPVSDFINHLIHSSSKGELFLIHVFAPIKCR